MSKPGRNDPCPCGSGKKFKQCCLGAAAAPVADGDHRQAMQTAIACHRAGDLVRAAALYREVLARSPRHPDALHLLGLIAQGAGRYDEALDLIGRAIAIRRDEPGYHNNLGLVLRDLGRLDDAAAACRRALALDPGFVEAHNNLGLIQSAQGDLAAAGDSFRRALAARPGFAQAHCNLAGVLNRQEALDAAQSHAERALALNPDFLEAWGILGLVQQKRGDSDRAIACFQRALTLNPDMPGICWSLAVELIRQGRYDEAGAMLERALALDPAQPEAHYYLGYLRLLQGRHAAAREACDRALALRPDYAAALDTRLFALLYDPATTREALWDAHRVYAETIEAPLRARWPTHCNTPDPERRLRIGYVSPDLHRHAVTNFLEPLLACRDRAGFEVTCYSHGRQHDEVTERLIAAGDHWVPCADLDDDALAARVSADGIDILVDLAGHTGYNRLPLFARKPAPVQVSYLGYPETTGLAAMDYRITTAVVDPAGSEQWHSERLWRLPRTLWCYRPPDDAQAAPGPLPALTSGRVTFGSMNNYSKLTSACLQLWVRILAAVPDARLLMTNVPTGSTRDELVAAFAAEGVDRARLALHGKLAFADFRATMAQVDIGLDPFPYNGTTTTCESLWMGIPVVTLIGTTSVSRSGAALLGAVGLAELCAASASDYVRIAVELARDRERLSGLRDGLRARMSASPLRDEAGVAREFEQACREMWRAWCAGRRGGSA